MATQKQITANRRNAQKSTGPTTPEGKAIVSQNAVTHGLTASTPMVLPGEEDAYRQIHNSLFEEWCPQEVRERLQVERIALCAVRLQRVARIETSVLISMCHKVSNPDPDMKSDASEATMPPEARLGHAYTAGSASLARLSRHERQLERSLNEGLNELELLQYARAMGSNPFYVRNGRKFPPIGNDRRSEEGSFKAHTSAKSTSAPAPSPIRRNSWHDDSGDILTPPGRQAA
jgi:hypothetical protein